MISVTYPPASAMATRARLMTTLLAAQVCGSTGHSLTLAVGSIVAADLTGDNTLSGLRWRLAHLAGRWRACHSPG